MAKRKGDSITGFDSERDHRGRFGLVLICLCMAVAFVHAESLTSPTTDEGGHLVRGLAWWTTPDTRLSWPHPPLGQLVTSAPGAIFGEPTSFEEMRGYDKADFISITRVYWRDYEEARGQLRVARWMMALLSILLAIYLYQWLVRRFGVSLALFTTVLFAANPILLAHAGLMTTDFPVAAVTLVALLQLHDYLKSPAWWRTLALALAVGALLTTKLTGFVVALLLLPPAAVYAIMRRGRFADRTSEQNALLILRNIFVVLVIGVLSVNLAYRFDDTGLSVAELIDHPEPRNWIGGDLVSERTTLGKLPGGLWLPIPFTYVFSGEFVRAQNRRGHAGYFMGKKTPKGVPGYFPILLAIKLPTGTVLLLLLGLALAARRRFRGLPLDVWLHGYFASAFLALTFNSHINLGVRHAILVVPSLVILAGRAANAGWTRGHRWKWAAVGCIASAVIGTAMAHPRYLGDFNWLVGGRTGGHYVSVIGEDWGQDVSELAEWQKKTGVPLAYHTKKSLRYAALQGMGVEFQKLGCDAVPPEGHWVAIHRSSRARQRSCVRRYADREPDVVLNDHILLFRPVEAEPAQ